MRTDKDRAFMLRKEGKSYNEIALALNVAKSTLSNWFKGQDFSEDIKRALTITSQTKSTARLQVLNRARGDLLQAYYTQAEREASEELIKYRDNQLFIAGVVAYWGEGDKSKSSLVRLANTDPQMIKLFRQFLLTFCLVPPEKIRGALYLYEDLDETECKKYWENNTGLQVFHKTMVLPSRHKTKKLPYGTCTILVSNTYLKRKLLTWIDQIPKIVLNTLPSGDK
ncbi:MAG: hypothetical protein RLZZ360_675 [Candidatus Parcubacteria bacterium]|jgi:transcriptional regulator with XRE-family HTH domain